jgi:glycosyl transferase family 25
MGKEKELGIDHIYVVHAPVGYERHAQRLHKCLKEKFEFDYEFFGTGESKEEFVPAYFVPNAKDDFDRGSLMCTQTHILFYERMVQNNDQMALILEDDPCFDRHFSDTISKIITEAQNLPPGIFISLENSTLKFPSRKVMRKGQYLYKAEYGRCAGAYIIDLRAAQNIMAHLQCHKCNTVIDHWHNDLVREHVFTMYWAYPSCVEQGSINGKMHAAKSTRMAGILRRISWLLQKYYKQYVLRMLR